VKLEGYLQVKPMHILERKVMVLYNKSIRKVKVQLKCYSHEELTWELEDTMQEAYPYFFLIEIMYICTPAW
jgi:hypothetical protein